MWGVFFVPPSTLPQPATRAQKDCASARGKPTTFRENSSSFPKNLWTFRHSPSTLHSARYLPLSPPQRQDSPTFRTQNPRKIAQSCVHLNDSRLLAVENRVFFLMPHPISSDCSAHTSLPKDCHLCQIATFLSYCGRKATGNVGLLTNIFYLCYLKCADLSSFFRPICRKPRCDSPRNDRLQTHYLYARTRAKELCLPFPLRKICFTLCQ